MAGPLAEDFFGGDGFHGSNGDTEQVKDFAIHVGLSKGEGIELMKRACRAADDLVTKHQDALREIAVQPATKGRLDGDTVRAIIEKHGDASTELP